jgi:hypothetical protein
MSDNDKANCIVPGDDPAMQLAYMCVGMHPDEFAKVEDQLEETLAALARTDSDDDKVARITPAPVSHLKP